MTQSPQQREPSAALRSWLATALPDLRSIEPMRGGAGARRYWRVRSADGSSAVCMEAFEEDPAILPPALRRARGFPFLEMTSWLAERGFPVPRLHAAEPRQRWLLLEDLGSRHLFDLPPIERLAQYRNAVELLAQLHSLPSSGPQDALPYARQFDHEWILFELRLFHGELSDPQLRAAVDRGFEALADYVAELPRCVCLRDFQSHNLMLDAPGHLRILDYQDALIAAPELDLAALLHDSYVELSSGEREALLGHYERSRGSAVPRTALAALIVQRKCKDLSRFRGLVGRGDERYRDAGGRAARSIREALAGLPAELGTIRPTLESALGRIGL